MSGLLFVLGCLGLFLVLLPIWAAVEARRANNATRTLQDRVDDLSARMAALAPAAARTSREAPRAVRPEPAAGPIPASPPPVAGPAVAPAAAAAPAISAPHPLPAPSAPAIPPQPLPAPVFPPPPPPRRPLDWESLISVRAFAWLGGAALFLAMGLFLQYSIQHNLISPAARIAIGLLVGAVALAGGDFLRTRGDWAGQATSGAGVAILYASLFAAHSRYALLGTAATFAGMAFVTLVAGLLAARRGAFVVAVLGLVGGFLTPFLLATHEDHAVALFAYTLLLDLGAIAVSRSRRWLSLGFLALAGSAVLYLGWADVHLDAANAPFALLAAVILAALFALLEKGRGQPEAGPRDAMTTLAFLAVAGPFAAVFAMSARTALAVSPAFLAGYLLVLAGGAFLASRNAGFPPLVPIAAALSVGTLSARIAADLVSRRTETLLLFLLVPAGYLALALRRRDEAGAADRAAAAISLAGGFLVLTRFLELAPKAPVMSLWAYAAANAAGLLAIGTLLASGAWIAGAQTLLFASLLLLTSVFHPERLSEFLPLILGPAAAFWALPFLSPRWRRDRLAWFSSALAPILHFPVLYVLAKPAWGSSTLGAVAIVFAIAALLALKRSAAILESADDRRFAMALFGAITLVFVTAAIPILLDREWITIAWALEAAALAWLWRRLPSDGLVYASAGLAAASFLRLLANPALWHYHARSGTRIFNWYLYTFGIPAAAFLAAAGLLMGSAWAERNRLPAALRGAAGILLFVLVNVEIADFYSTGEALRFRLSGGDVGEDMTYSLAWGVFALVLMGLGITRASRPMRAAALGVLLLTIGKVFLHDLWDLGALYRVGSILGLAVALLAVSFLTQRFVFARERP